MPECVSGPHGCGIWAWVFDYQTLIAGLAALLAAIITVRWTRSAEVGRQQRLVSSLTIEISEYSLGVMVALQQLRDRWIEKDPRIHLHEIPTVMERSHAAIDFSAEARGLLRDVDVYSMMRLRMALQILFLDAKNAAGLAQLVKEEAAEAGTHIKDRSSFDEVIDSLNTVLAQAEAKSPKEQMAQKLKRLLLDW